MNLGQPMLPLYPLPLPVSGRGMAGSLGQVRQIPFMEGQLLPWPHCELWVTELGVSLPSLTSEGPQGNHS